LTLCWRDAKAWLHQRREGNLAGQRTKEGKLLCGGQITYPWCFMLHPCPERDFADGGFKLILWVPQAILYHQISMGSPGGWGQNCKPLHAPFSCDYLASLSLHEQSNNNKLAASQFMSDTGCTLCCCGGGCPYQHFACFSFAHIYICEPPSQEPTHRAHYVMHRARAPCGIMQSRFWYHYATLPVITRRGQRGRTSKLLSHIEQQQQQRPPESNCALMACIAGEIATVVTGGHSN